MFTYLLVLSRKNWHEHVYLSDFYFFMWIAVINLGQKVSTSLKIRVGPAVHMYLECPAVAKQQQKNEQNTLLKTKFNVL